jgi:hypothetical protein
VQRLSDTWRAPIGSAALMILHAYFESQQYLDNSDDARQQFSQRQLENERFVYGDPVTVPGRIKVCFIVLTNAQLLDYFQQRIKFPFHGSLVIQTFAHHLSITKGSKWVPGLKHTCPTTRPYGGLVLATVAVRLLSFLFMVHHAEWVILAG